MIMIVCVPHYFQSGEKFAVCTAVGVGSKGIEFPLDENRENICRQGMLTPKDFRILTGNSGRTRLLFPAVDKVFADDRL